MTPPDNDKRLETLVSDVIEALKEIEAVLGWAYEEIAAASARHPSAADALAGSLPLLRPTHPLLGTEDLFRAHCVELLDRVARGSDTTFGTAAECCVVLSKVSLEVPLPTHAVGLYSRMWRQAGLRPDELAATGTHYEAIVGTQIDDLEADIRRRLRQDWRVLRTGEQQPSS